MNYIHQQAGWPNFTWKGERLLFLVGRVRNLQGKIVGKMGSLGFDLQNNANLAMLTRNVVKTSEIEGELLHPDQVRSSVAKRLGLDISGLVSSNRNVDGVVDMMLDATENFKDPVTVERLFSWHTSLFPLGRNRMYDLRVGQWRDDASGPMRVLSGPIGKEKVHFQAPDARYVPFEMRQFLDWFNNGPEIDDVIKAAVAHIWFLTIHPFEDGNGRIARAISDLLLARSDGQSSRFYSMSSQIEAERKDYYTILETIQKGKLDISVWIEWFLTCLERAILASNELLGDIIFKHHFWLKYAQSVENERQTKILNRLLDGFQGKMNTSKWAKITKCSHDTALRDIQDLVAKGILIKLPGGGRSTAYDLNKD